MLFPAEVRPFLSHEDGFVRDLALDYLWDAHDPGGTTQEDLWATIDRYGKAPRDPKEERRTFAQCLVSFPPTERSTERLLEGLRIEADTDVMRHLVRAAAALPPESVRRLLDDPRIVHRLSTPEAPREVLDPEHVHPSDVLRRKLEARRVTFRPSPEVVEGLREDLDLAGRSAHVLARELYDLAMRLDRTTLLPDGWRDVEESPLLRRGERLVRALARHPDPAAEGALYFLRHPGGHGVWEETFALMIFARVPLPGVEERVLEILDEEEVTFAGSCARDALVRLGTPEVIRFDRRAVRRPERPALRPRARRHRPDQAPRVGGHAPPPVHASAGLYRAHGARQDPLRAVYDLAHGARGHRGDGADPGVRRNVRRAGRELVRAADDGRARARGG